MSRRHVAIFTETAKGHINPVLGICQELMRRDYRVTFAIGEHGAHWIRQAGLEPAILNYGSLLSAGFDSPKWPARDPKWWEFLADCYLFDTRRAALAVAQLEAFYRENPPDAILYDDCSYAGRIIAKYTNSMPVQFYTTFARDKFITWEDGVGRNPEPMLEFAKALDSFFLAYGLEGSNHLWHNDDLNISPMPRALQYEADRFDGRFCFVGPSLRSYTNSWQSSGNGKQSILVSDAAGTADVEYFDSFVTALSGSGYNVILSVGENFPVDRLLPLPANFEINQHLPNLEILQNVDLYICAGGGYSTLEALHFGVPMLLFPIWPPQEVVAARIHELGLGINLPRHSMTPEMIKRNVAGILGDAAIAQNVRRMQHIVQNSGGAVLAVDKMEEALLERG